MTLVLTATASGKTDPKVKGDRQILNDAFHIVSNSAGQPTGDGVNESTYWVFDFTNPDYLALDRDREFKSAMLTLVLEPRSPAVETDSVTVHELDRIMVFSKLTVGKIHTVEIDLLEYYSSSEIISALWGMWLPMRYEEDAIVSMAKIQLEQ